MTLPDPLHALLAIAALVIGAGCVGAAVRRIGQPHVIGVICWAIGIGSLHYAGLTPAAPTGTRSLLHALGQFGLLLYMFIVGQELLWPLPRAAHRPQSGPREHRLAVPGPALAVNLLLPLVLGAVAATPLAERFGSDHVPRWSTVAFMGLALTVTAVPVLAAIVTERGLHTSPLGRLAIVLAVWNDGIVWAGVTALVAVAASGHLPSPAVALTAAAALAGAIIVPRTMMARVPGIHRTPAVLLPTVVAVATVGAAATDALGIHPAVGALVAGVALPRDAAVDAVTTTLRAFTETFLLPLFFIDLAFSAPVQILGRLTGWAAVGCAVLLTTAIVSKAGAGLLSGRFCRLAPADRLALAALLNCRGVTEFAVATVGVQAGLINHVAFAVLALIALLATAITAPLLDVADRIRRRRLNMTTADRAIAGVPTAGRAATLTGAHPRP